MVVAVGGKGGGDGGQTRCRALQRAPRSCGESRRFHPPCSSSDGSKVKVDEEDEEDEAKKNKDGEDEEKEEEEH